MEGEECWWSIKIGKGRINLPEGNWPMLRGIELGGLSFDSFWKSA